MKKIVMLIAGLLIVVLSACGSNEIGMVEKEEIKVIEEEFKERENELEAKEEEIRVREKEFATKEEELKAREEEFAAKEEEVKVREEETNAKTEKINNAANDFDNLSLAIRVHLATSIVDERADSQDLTGYTLYYNMVGDQLFVIVHSGVGNSHPVFKIQINSDSITPIDGLVAPGGDVEEVEVNSSTISKEDLYNHYSEHKNIYESGQSNVEQEPSITTDNYEFMKNEIYGE